jgi:splicing factor 1
MAEGLPDISVDHEQDHDPSIPLLRNEAESSAISDAPSRPGIPINNAAASRVLAKIDRAIIPLLFITYMFNFMDKVILSSAAVFGLREDTVCPLF